MRNKKEKNKKKHKYDFHNTKDNYGMRGYCQDGIPVYGDYVFIWFNGQLGHCAVSEVLEKNGFKLDFVQVMKYAVPAKSGKGLVFTMRIDELLQFKIDKNKRSFLDKPEPIQKPFEPKTLRRPKWDKRILDDGKIAWFDSSGNFVAFEPD